MRPPSRAPPALCASTSTPIVSFVVFWTLPGHQRDTDRHHGSPPCKVPPRLCPVLCRGPTRTLLVADLPLRRKDPSLRLSVPLPAPLSRALPPACLPLLQLPDCHGHRLPRGPGRRPRHSPECERALALAGGAALPHTGAADISLQLCSLFRRGDWQWGALLVSNAAMHARLASSGLTACLPARLASPARPPRRRCATAAT
jgi:hypothetical protein